MDFRLASLPYSENALEPHLGAETLQLHHGKHHAGYLKRLEERLGGKPEALESLETIVRTASGSVLENAAQCWNHDFLWKSMDPDGGGDPSGELAEAIRCDFGSMDAFRKSFLNKGTMHFGSGWLWLSIDDKKHLFVETTHDADLPLRHGRIPLVTADLWEHAYYLDYRNERHAYLVAFVDHLINWEFAAENWAVSARKRGL